MKKSTTFFFFLMLGLLQDTFSQTTGLDLSFGTGGFVSTDVNTHDDEANDILIQPDGKVLVAGTAILQSYSKFAVIRYNADGTIDSTFADNGIATANVGPVNDKGTSLALQNDGKILLAGNYGWNFYNDPAIVRFNSNGTIDSTFGDNGYSRFIISNQYDEFNDIALQNDGKIVVGGRTWLNNSYNFLIARILPSGAIDSSFGVNGMVVTDFLNSNDCIHSLLIQSDGRILVSGNTEPGASYFAAARYFSNGTPDPSFGIGGKLFIGTGSRYDVSYGMSLTADSSIILAGSHGSGNIYNYQVAKLTKFGVLDSTFGTDGIKLIPVTVPADHLKDVLVQKDGKIVAAGMADGDALILRLTANGALDNSFGNQGIYIGNNGGSEGRLNAITQLADSSIIACGYTKPGNNFDVFLVKFLNNIPTGIVQHDKRSFPISLYPNPATGFVMVDLPLMEQPTALINIYNESGKLVHQQQFEIYNSSARIDLDNNLAPGLYILRISCDGKTASQKFMIN